LLAVRFTERALRHRTAVAPEFNASVTGRHLTRAPGQHLCEAVDRVRRAEHQQLRRAGDERLTAGRLEVVVSPPVRLGGQPIDQNLPTTCGLP